MTKTLVQREEDGALHKSSEIYKKENHKYTKKEKNKLLSVSSFSVSMYVLFSVTDECRIMKKNPLISIYYLNLKPIFCKFFVKRGKK